MPHLIIEYSDNVADLVEIQDVVSALHDAALATGIAPLDALRTRAVARQHYAIADRHPSNAFVAVTARLGPGRSEADKQAMLGALMGSLNDALGDAGESVMLSVEYQEIDPDLRLSQNNLRPVIAERQANLRESD